LSDWLGGDGKLEGDAMGAYNYKYVRDQLPPYLTDEVDGYEGSVDYDGDQWAAASSYIYELETELAKQYARTKSMDNERLLNWLKNRQESNYCGGAAIVDA
jgi:hypothetical protein